MALTMQQPLLTASPSPSSKSISRCFLLSLLAFLSSATLITFFIPSSHLLDLCDHAPAAKTPCRQILSKFIPRTTSRRNVLHLLLHDSASRVHMAAGRANLVASMVNDQRQRAALAACADLFDLSSDRLADSMKALQSVGRESDAHTWLSTVLTNHITCLDELSGQVKLALESEMEDLVSRARTILSVFVSMVSSTNEISTRGEFPEWLTKRDRELLRLSADGITPDVVVAKDGTGNFSNISEAVAAAPTNSKTRYVIYVKKGTYVEQVLFGKSQKNIMLVGDGMDRTIITGSLNVDDGSTTFNSATVAAVGDNFIAQDLCVQNTAGPGKHQAVALRLGADKSVINRCKLDAYQDTLYAHSNRQFYKECNVTGTVDFIFGNAAMVMQNCSLEPRRPISGQQNMVTAQGRTDPNQNTGISIQFCNITASPDLLPVMKSFPSYLGRPWKEYSRTVVMQSNISSVIDPAGWSLWDGSFALDTLFYGEFENVGPGSNTTGRVKWPGYHIITNRSVAEMFTVVNFIQGDTWLNYSGITYIPGL